MPQDSRGLSITCSSADALDTYDKALLDLWKLSDAGAENPEGRARNRWRFSHGTRRARLHHVDA